MSAQLHSRLQFRMGVFLKHIHHHTDKVISQYFRVLLYNTTHSWGHTKGFLDVVTAHTKRKVLCIIGASQGALFAPFVGGRAGATACLLLWI